MEYTGTDFYCDVALPNLDALTIEHETDDVIAFHHTRPHWQTHIVVAPKKHIASFTDRSTDDDVIIAELLEVVREVAAKVERETGAARVITNLGNYQDSKHLHFHICSGEKLEK